jgi:Uma2 family endonuclease
MTIAHPRAERRVVIEGVSWRLYQQMLAEIGDGHTRLTYDQGRLEIRSPTTRHELIKKILGRLLEAYADEMEVEVEGFGSTTFDREDLQKGLEPDECYYVQNAGAVKGRQEFDFSVDPPPDLAIEIDISPPDVARQPIYAALDIPEVWNYDGNQVRFLHRTLEDRYVIADRSLAFPQLPASELNRFLRIALVEGQTAAVRTLRQWCCGANR